MPHPKILLCNHPNSISCRVQNVIIIIIIIFAVLLFFTSSSTIVIHFPTNNENEPKPMFFPHLVAFF